MPGSIDELASQWRAQPNAALTIAMCDALRGVPRVTLVEEVGAFASRDHAGDATVLVAAARMYMAAQRLGDAQTALVSAGKAAKTDPHVYRLLGEVLLRRGDAERAVKVLERAIQFGATDPETRLWSERSKVFKSMQATAGMRAVAVEVQRTAPLDAPRPPMDSTGDTTTEVHVVRAPALGSTDDDDDDELTRRPAPIPSELVGKSEPPPRPPFHSTNTGTNVLAMPLGGDDEPSVTTQFPRDEKLPDYKNIDTADAFAPIGTAPPKPAPPPRDPFAQMNLGTSAGASQPLSLGANAHVSPQMHGRPPPEIAPRPMTPGSALPLLANGPPLAVEPRDVLDALEIAGLFEPSAMGAAPAAAWDAAQKKPRGRGFIALIVTTVLFVGATVGALVYVRDKRAKDHLESEQLLAKVSEILHSARASDLPQAEQLLSRSFDLDSRSPRAALEWMHERALLGLLKGGADIAFEDSISRAQEVGVKESDIAFARVASFLFQGDTVGAAALLPKWDDKANKDAWYEVLAGASLARAGDTHDVDRFAAAADLDPGLVIAQIELARATALDGDAAKAMERAKAVKDKLPGRPEGAALVTLAWARDPARSDPPPADADETIKNAADLPAPLQFIPHAVLAMRAIGAHDWPTAKDEVEKGLAVADGPGVAAWLGSIALDTGDEQLARKAALSAVSFSAVYPPARMLAARVALVGARLDEALKATEELDATSPDVAVVRGAVAYERLDVDGLGRALEAIPESEQKLPFLAAIQLAPQVLVGDGAIDPARLVDMADDEAPWSDLVAMDAALDQGEMDQADAIAAQWKGGEDRPLRVLRLARLSRYEAHLDAAEADSVAALNRVTVTPRVLAERVFVMVARGRAIDAGPLLAKYPLVLGPLGTWLSAYAVASQGKIEEAKARTSTLDPPPSGAPLTARVIAATALAAMHERRRVVDILKPILAAGYVGVDVQNAAIAVGYKRVDHKGKKPTFDAP
jgi:tetratricopeptide (TPR) repeat protein